MKRILDSSLNVRIVRETLSDGSYAYNVELVNHDAGEAGNMTIECVDAAAAGSLFRWLCDSRNVSSIQP